MGKQRLGINVISLIAVLREEARLVAWPPIALAPIHRRDDCGGVLKV